MTELFSDGLVLYNEGRLKNRFSGKIISFLCRFSLYRNEMIFAENPTGRAVQPLVFI